MLENVLDSRRIVEIQENASKTFVDEQAAEPTTVAGIIVNE